ncbi:hypothetical protein KUCAC02_037009, partial [Chaenocephalus aceratus]
VSSGPCERLGIERSLCSAYRHRPMADSRTDDLQTEMEERMGVFVIRKEGEGLQEPPADIGIIVEVLNELPSACALLL